MSRYRGGGDAKVYVGDLGEDELCGTFLVRNSFDLSVFTNSRGRCIEGGLGVRVRLLRTVEERLGRPEPARLRFYRFRGRP